MKLETECLKASQLVDNAEYEQALQHYENALGILNFDRVSVYNNYANALLKLERFDDAYNYFKKALALTTEIADVFFNLAGLQLKICEFEQGWLNYRARWYCKNSKSRLRHKKIQLYQEEVSPSSNTKILIAAEQGIGDEIMYLSLLPELMTKWQCDLTVEVEPRLLNLFRRSYPTLKFIAHSEPEHLPVVDYQIGLGDIPRFLIKHKEDFKPTITLQTDQNTVKYFQQKYQELFPQKKCVGIAWDSSKSNKGLNLQELAVILKSHRNIQFINLQYNIKPKENYLQQQLTKIKNEYGVDIYNDPDVNPLKETDKSAAQIKVLDSIVSISNTTVHLAGAVGQTVHLLLPMGYSWRWGHPDDTQCYWYPGVKFYKSKNIKGFSDVVEQVRGELQSYATNYA